MHPRREGTRGREARGRRLPLVPAICTLWKARSLSQLGEYVLHASESTLADAKAQEGGGRTLSARS